MQALNQLLTQLLNQFNSIDQFLRDCQVSIKLEDLNMAELNLNDKRRFKSKEVLRKGISDSYRQTFDNLAKIAQSKAKFLKSLIFWTKTYVIDLLKTQSLIKYNYNWF